MSGQRPFDPAELGTEPRDELDDAKVVADRLGAAIDPGTVTPADVAGLEHPVPGAYSRLKRAASRGSQPRRSHS